MLDTLIKIEQDASLIMIKPGKKTALFEISNARGPSLETVKAKVVEILAGRTVIGYHAKNRLVELGVYHLLQNDDKLVNCSTLFNTEGKTEP